MRASTLLIATLGMAAAPAMAAEPCSQEMTRGYWAFNCDGFATALPPAAATLTPTRFFGTCSADSNAFFTCDGSYNVGGQVLPITAEGQADTKKDCTGTITYDEYLGEIPIGQLMVRYTVLDGGDTIWGLPVANVPASPQVLSCNLRRMSR